MDMSGGALKWSGEKQGSGVGEGKEIGWGKGWKWGGGAPKLEWGSRLSFISLSLFSFEQQVPWPGLVLGSLG